MAQPQATAPRDGGVEIRAIAPNALGWFFAAVNRTLAREAEIRSRVAVYRNGTDLSPRMRIAQETGWLVPMLRDLLSKDIAVVINELDLLRPVAEEVSRLTGLPADWMFQHNLYVTPRDNQAFAPHCDPHLVVIAQLYGRKDWVFYDRQADNPLMTDGATMAAKPGEKLPPLHRFTVEPGQCFVIPRGRFHAARSLTAASVHISIGCAGARPVDSIWAIARAAMADSSLRADLDPAAALARAQKFLRGFSPGPMPLPRNPIVGIPDGAAPGAPVLCFEEALRALPGV